MRFLCTIAGIDYDILRRCPMTDRMWAAQLGLWLLLAFVLLALITFHSTGYVPGLAENAPMRAGVAVVVGLIIFFFDRALFQSDWFRHGYFRHDHPSPARSLADRADRALRIAVRLAISFGIAFVLSLFLELAFFSASITDHQERQQQRANAPIIAKMGEYRKAQEADATSRRTAIAERQKEIAALRQRLDGEPVAADPKFQDIARQQATVAAREQQLLADIRAKEAEIVDRETEAIAEMHGTQPDRRNPARFSGIPTCGARCRTAQQLAAVHKAELKRLQDDLAGVQAESRRLSDAKDAATAEFKRAAERQQHGLDQRGRDLAEETARLQADLAAFENGMAVRVKAYEDEMRRSPGWVELRTDPLLRLNALQDLKSDEVYGAAISTVSLYLKLFIIFLEVIPVIGKIFFSPPSAYAIHVQKRVERHQRLDLDACEPAQAAQDASAESAWGGWQRQANGPSRTPSGRTTPRRRHLTIVPSNSEDTST